MKAAIPKPQRCAIYTRKSTEHNLDLAFNSLDAQREACEAHIKSQAHEGWKLIRDKFDDGGLSGASLLQRKDRDGLLSLKVIRGALHASTKALHGVLLRVEVDVDEGSQPRTRCRAFSLRVAAQEFGLIAPFMSRNRLDFRRKGRIAVCVGRWTWLPDDTIRARLAVCGALGGASVNSDAATQRSPTPRRRFPPRSLRTPRAPRRRRRAPNRTRRLGARLRLLRSLPRHRHSPTKHRQRL